MIVDAWRLSLALGSLQDDAYGLVVEVRGALYPLTYSRPDCSTACVYCAERVLKVRVRKHPYSSVG